MTTNWTQKYLKEAISDEIELARLLGHGKVTRPATLSMYTLLQRSTAARTGRGTLSSDSSPGTSSLPMWRRSWGGAGALVSTHFLQIKHDTDEGSVSVGASDRRRSITEAYCDHPSVDAATWAAIVRATIQLRTEA